MIVEYDSVKEIDGAFAVEAALGIKLTGAQILLLADILKEIWQDGARIEREAQDYD